MTPGPLPDFQAPSLPAPAPDQADLPQTSPGSGDPAGDSCDDPAGESCDESCDESGDEAGDEAGEALFLMMGEGFSGITDALTAGGAESRRTARRQMDVLKEFGGALTAIGNMVRDLHTAAREPAATSAPASPDTVSADLLLPLIEMSDRIARAAAAFQQPPAAAAPWWPGAKAALAPWQAAWSSQRDALFILASHMDTLLARAGLVRVPSAGGTFDPSLMSAVEVITDPALPDHSVTAELLPGWRLAGGGIIIRPAQVRVSRQA